MLTVLPNMILEVYPHENAKSLFEQNGALIDLYRCLLGGQFYDPSCPSLFPFLTQLFLDFISLWSYNPVREGSNRSTEISLLGVVCFDRLRLFDAYYRRFHHAKKPKHRESSSASSCPTPWPSGWRSTTSQSRWASICKWAGSRL